MKKIKTNIGTHCVRPKENGITLIALIITIIVMLILVGVTINVAINGGLFGKSKTARTETEKNSIYDQMLAMLEFEGNGDIKVADVYNNKISKTFNVDPESVLEGTEKVTFTVEGEYGDYKYKLTKKELIKDSEDDPPPPIAGEDAYFKFEQIDEIMTLMASEYVNEEYTLEDVKEEYLSQFLMELPEETALEMGIDGSITVVSIPGDIFWSYICLKNYSEKYGVEMPNMNLRNYEPKHTITCSIPDPEGTTEGTTGHFKEIYKENGDFIPIGTEGIHGFIFIDQGYDNISIALFDETKTGEYTPLIAKDEDDKWLTNWNNFIATYGEEKFIFDGSKDIQEMVTISFSGNYLKNYPDDVIIEKGGRIEVLLEAEEGHILPETIQLTKVDYTNFEEIELTNGVDCNWEWDRTTGKLIIENVTDNITVNVETFGIDTWTNNVSASSQYYNFNGEYYTNTFTADNGYALPETITVREKNSEKELIDGIDYFWDKTTGKLQICDIIAEDLIVEVFGTYDCVNVNISASNCYYNGWETNDVARGTEYTNIFTPYNLYVLPEIITVKKTNSEEELMEGAEYTWDNTTGELKIFEVTEEITISIVPEYNAVEVNVNGYTRHITSGDTYSGTVIPESNYGFLDVAVQVKKKNSEEYITEGVNWNYSTGELIIENVTEDLIVHIKTGKLRKEYTNENTNMKYIWELIGGKYYRTEIDTTTNTTIVNRIETNEGMDLEDITGDSQYRNWIILYDDGNGNYEAANANIASDLTLGSNQDVNWEDENILIEAEIYKAGLNNQEKAIYSYNNAITTINNACKNIQGLPTNNDVRTIGAKTDPMGEGIPDKTDSRAIDSYMYDIPNFNSNVFDKILKKGDEVNYLDDYYRLKLSNIYGFYDDYWIASRAVTIRDGYIRQFEFEICMIHNNILEREELCVCQEYLTSDPWNQFLYSSKTAKVIPIISVYVP